MHRELVAYNALLADSFIDIPLYENPWVVRSDDRGREVRVLIDHHHHFVRRIFSRGDWGSNGRFYGPWWQQLDKKSRSLIFINDTPTVEVDFRGLHVAILSAERGVEIRDDPYKLPTGLVGGAPAALQRSIVKKLVVTALNARTKEAAFASFREGYPKGHLAKTMSNKELERLLRAFIERHPYLDELLCSDQGIRLMNIDSQIAALVLGSFTRKGIPVLSVHDSFIAPYTHIAELKREMALAAEQVVGIPLAVTASGPALDEFVRGSDAELSFLSDRQTPRSDGYLGRLKEWERRKGRQVVP